MSPRQAVVAEALSWVGTPYHHHGRVKGVGVDCAMLLAEVFESCGLVPHVDAGFYPVDWHDHRTEELFIEWLLRCGARELPEQTSARPGDVAVFRFGHTYSHGAVLVDESGLMVHALHKARAVVFTRRSEFPLNRHECRFFTLFSD